MSVIVFPDRSRRKARLGSVVAALVLGMFGAAVVGWIVMQSASPLTLEGWYLYPMAAGGFVGAAMAARRAQALRV
jgi:predicted tellurium resistance membrane protein TerC